MNDELKPCATPQGTDANGSPVQDHAAECPDCVPEPRITLADEPNPTDGKILAAEHIFKPHAGADPKQVMAQLHHAEAAAAADRTRQRLTMAAANAFAAAYNIPAEHVVLHEMSDIAPDGTHRVRFFFLANDEQEQAQLDSRLALAQHFVNLGWRWREDGALMRPCDNCAKGKGVTGAVCERHGKCSCDCAQCDKLGEFVEVEAPVAKT